MNKLLLFYILSIAICVAGEPSYVVLNVLGETISAGEWLSSPTNDISTVGSLPNQIIAYGPDEIWVVASGEAKIQKLSVGGGSATIDDEYALPAGSNPYLMFEFNDTIYTTLWVSGGLGIVDIASGTTTALDSFCLGPQGVFADSDYVYVTAGNLDPITFEYGPGMIYRLNHSGDVVDNLEIGTNPQQIIEGPDGYLHVVSTGDYMSVPGSVYIIDRETFAVADSINIGGNPQRLCADPFSNIIYSVTSVWGTAGSGRILAYDGVSHDILWSSSDTENSIQSTGLSGLAVRDNYIYIPSMDSSWVEIIHVEGSSFAQIAKYTTGYGPLDVDFYYPAVIAEECRPEEVSLSVYPNPFNGKCKIVAPYGSEIHVFDLKGRLVEELGEGKTEWAPAPGIASGIFLIKAYSGKRIFTNTVCFIK